MAVSLDIINILATEMRSEAEAYLEEFRKRTPGYDMQHVTVDVPEHEHAKDRPPYTQQLVNGWIFTSAAFSGSAGKGKGYQIASIVNATPYVEYVEYGWESKGGKLVPGHFMAQNAIRIGEVMNMYAINSHKAMVVSLAKGNWNIGKGVSEGRAFFGGGAISSEGGDGVYVRWQKGKIQVKGGVRGVSSDTYARIASNLADMLIAGLS